MVIAIIGIAAAFWMIWVFGLEASNVEEPKPAMKHEKGVALKPGELKAGEEIVVVRHTPRRPPQELRFRPGPTLIVSELDWEGGAPTKLVRVRFARELAPAEVKGVEAVIDYLRRQQRGPTRLHSIECRIEHVRDGIVIGRETLIETPLLDEWTTAYRHQLGNPEFMRELEDRARDAGLTLEEVKQWVTFAMLLDEEGLELRGEG
jgi:hypothetical protein